MTIDAHARRKRTRSYRGIINLFVTPTQNGQPRRRGRRGRRTGDTLNEASRTGVPAVMLVAMDDLVNEDAHDLGMRAGLGVQDVLQGEVDLLLRAAMVGPRGVVGVRYARH